MANKPHSAAPARRQLPQRDVQEIMVLLQQGATAKAEAKARQLLKKFPGALMVADLLANALLAQGKFGEASKILEKILKLKPDHWNGHYNLGVAWMNTGERDKAIGQFELLIAKTGGNADVFNNLGVALYELERFNEAVEAYEKAVALKPDFVPALRNLGAALRKSARLEESEKVLEKLPVLAPKFVPGHLSLGATRRRLGKTKEAQASFDKVLALDPDNREAHNELGNIAFAAGDYEKAIGHFARVDTPAGRVMVLEAKHQAGAGEELLDEVSAMNAREPDNLRLAAFSAFLHNQYGAGDGHPFAPDPLEFVSIRRIDDALAKNPDLLNALMAEAERVKTFWENHTTRGGFQTQGNLFREAEVFGQLEKLVRGEIEAYRRERADSSAGLIRNFPKKFDMDGWHVKLKKSGYQKSHIHARGWISGVLYLKVPENTSGDEGSIRFSLHGYDYRKVHDDIPQLLHKPKPGDLVLFPSSLFHNTVPFEADEERECIAFDMVP